MNIWNTEWYAVQKECFVCGLFTRSDKLNNQNIKPSADSLMFAKEIHTLPTYLGIKLIKMTHMAHNFTCKNILLIKYVKLLFGVIAQATR